MSESSMRAEVVKQAPPVISLAEKITEKLCDFHDRLPPMVVKELRQGMRARAFTGVFLTLQGFLALVMLFAISSGGDSDTGKTISQIIFFFFTLAVLCIQPLRAVNCLHNEIKSGAIDLMVLTKLSARRIAFGKWAAIMAQSGLIFVSIIPYLILRYFFGGMNLFAELLTMTTILIFSGCITAINVGVSANGAVLLRSLVPLAAAAFLFFATMGMLNRGFSGLIEFMSMEYEYAWAIYGGFLLGALYLSWTLFGLAISAIAPLAENHSTLNRLVSLAVMVVVLGTMYFVNADKLTYPLVMGCVALPVVLFAFCEPQYLLAIVTRPFVKRGALGRICGSFLYPCSSAGIFFGLGMLLLVVVTAQIVYGDSTGGDSEEMHIFINSACGSMAFAGVILQLILKKITNLLGVFIGILMAGFIVLGAVGAICESMDSESAGLFFFWIPQVNFYNLSNNQDATLSLSYLILFIYSGALFVFGLRGRSYVTQAEQEEMGIQKPEEKANESLA